MKLPHWVRAVAVALVAAMAAAKAQAPVEVRIALVIGNAAYAAFPLLNPVKDAQAMSATLKRIGFRVLEVNDGSKAQVERAVTEMKGMLSGRNGIGMLYYAGHGIQLDWHNYMLPVDANPLRAADVPAQAVDIQYVIDAFREAGNRMNIIVLDACRDNPFGSTSSARGLAPLDAPPGTFLAYATAPGNVAEDGTSETGNGLYTGFLVDELSQPQTRIEDVFKRVRLKVRQASQGRQIPWESTSLEEDFVFATGQKVDPPSVQDRDTAFKEQKTHWDRIRGSKVAKEYYDFLAQYPSGPLSELAQARIEELQASALKPSAGKDGLAIEDASRRYRDGDRYEFVFAKAATGSETGRGSITVRRVGDGVFEAMGVGMPTARVTSFGFVVSDSGGTYDPPWAELPAGPFQLGKRWTGRSILTRPNGQKVWVEIETQVVAREKVTVPLGTFDTYKVDVRILSEDGREQRMSFWYDPAWGYAVKKAYQSNRPGAAPEAYIREVVRRTRNE